MQMLVGREIVPLPPNAGALIPQSPGNRLPGDFTRVKANPDGGPPGRKIARAIRFLRHWRGRNPGQIDDGKLDLGVSIALVQRGIAEWADAAPAQTFSARSEPVASASQPARCEEGERGRAGEGENGRGAEGEKKPLAAQPASAQPSNSKHKPPKLRTG